MIRTLLLWLLRPRVLDGLRTIEPSAPLKPMTGGQPSQALGPNQIAWIEAKIPNVKHCAAAVAARDESSRKAREMAA